jgi:hypothetical protein
LNNVFLEQNAVVAQLGHLQPCLPPPPPRRRARRKPRCPVQPPPQFVRPPVSSQRLSEADSGVDSLESLSPIEITAASPCSNTSPRHQSNFKLYSDLLPKHLLELKGVSGTTSSPVYSLSAQMTPSSGNVYISCTYYDTVDVYYIIRRKLLHTPIANTIIVILSDWEL